MQYYQQLDGLHSKIQAGSVKSLKPGEAYYPMPTDISKFLKAGHWNSLGDLMPIGKPKHLDLFT